MVGQRPLDLRCTLKFARYAEGGIGQYWIADPGDGSRPPSVQVYDLVDGGYRLTGEASGRQSLRCPAQYR
jgi:hypothetical protein